MKKVLIALCITCAVAFAVQAEDGKEAPKKKHEPSAEMKALLEKYDTNKDGKLDKEERAKMTAEDKAKLKSAHPGQKKDGDKDGDKK